MKLIFQVWGPNLFDYPSYSKLLRHQLINEVKTGKTHESVKEHHGAQSLDSIQLFAVYSTPQTPDCLAIRLTSKHRRQQLVTLKTLNLKLTEQRRTIK